MVASVAHEVGVHDVVLDDAAADDDGARVPRLHGERIDVADVLDDVQDNAPPLRAHTTEYTHTPRSQQEVKRPGTGGARAYLVRVKEEHVADGAVCKRWAEDRDVVHRAPVVDAVLVVNLEAHALDEGGGRPRLSRGKLRACLGR
jgi:hypothetical protein